MADGGHRVWGVTLVGFGRSEKPNIPYTELIWAELLRDFIVDVVREPVHLVGNSIGGRHVPIVSVTNYLYFSVLFIYYLQINSYM